MMETTIFFRQLATLLSSGISIIEALTLSISVQEKIAMQTLLTTLKHSLESGRNFSQSLTAYPSLFDSNTCYLIHIGEETGKLASILTHIVKQREKTFALQSKIKQSLFYPMIIFTVGIIVSLIMLLWVVPHFAALFDQLPTKLPLITLIIIHLSQFLRSALLPGTVILLIFIFLCLYFKSSPLYKTQCDKLLFIPPIKKIYQKVSLIRICYSLATLLSAGIPIRDALSMTANISQNHLIKNTLIQTRQQVETGDKLGNAIQNTFVFTHFAVQMVKIGEESGTLDSMLEKVAEFYEQEIDTATSHFTQLLEPLIIIILGVLIGGLVIAMYLPIFKLGTIF